MSRRTVPAKTGWRKHVEGWQAGVVLMVSALVPALLAVPHGVVSRELPLPRIDRAEQYRVSVAEAKLVESGTLPYEVRAVGEALRRHGAQLARDQSAPAERTSKEIRDAVQTARKSHPLDTLLQLRAVQTRLFLLAMDRFNDAPSKPNPELSELGGEFLQQARQGGWLGSQGLRATRDELRTWFVIRWNVLTELSREPQFAVSLNDWRCYYRFLLRPDHEPADVPVRDMAGYRARVVAALAQKDPDYPLDLAQGLLSCQLGEYTQCADQLQRHLQRSPEGPWSLRVRNTLTVATAGLDTPEP